MAALLAAPMRRMMAVQSWLWELGQAERDRVSGTSNDLLYRLGWLALFTGNEPIFGEGSPAAVRQRTQTQSLH
jgi:hypothetical protein